MVTNECNSAMKRILPKQRIQLVEIPRKTIDNQCISVSLIRKYLEEYDLEKLHPLVPETTCKILFSEDL